MVEQIIITRNIESGMQNSHNFEELLRETACLGNVDKVEVLIRAGVDVNSQNSVNGWTALHWASKRNHMKVVSCLLQSGADSTIPSFKDELAVVLTQSEDIRQLLLDQKVKNADTFTLEHQGTAMSNLESANQHAKKSSSPSGFVPNYLSNPEFPYSESVAEFAARLGVQDNVHQVTHTNSMITSRLNNCSNYNEDDCPAPSLSDALLILKCRLADSEETDFIEIELGRQDLTYEGLVEACTAEFNVDQASLKKIRKLPNTMVRNDRDVKRLVPFQELEVVMK